MRKSQTKTRKRIEKLSSFVWEKQESRSVSLWNWYKYTFWWCVNCVNVHLGVVPDWISSGVFPLLSQVVVQTFAKCWICPACLLWGYPASSTLLSCVCFHPQVFLLLTEYCCSWCSSLYCIPRARCPSPPNYPQHLPMPTHQKEKHKKCPKLKGCIFKQHNQIVGPFFGMRWV